MNRRRSTRVHPGPKEKKQAPDPALNTIFPCRGQVILQQ